MALSVETRQMGDAIVLSLKGDLDMASAEQARVAIEQAESVRPPVLVLDLGQLEFFDSTGLRLVIKAGSRAGIENRRLVVVPGEATQALVLTVKPDELFEIAASAEDALGQAG